MHCYHYYQALSTHIEKEPRAGHRSCLIRARTIDWQRGTGEVRRTEVCPRNKCNSSRWNGKPVAGSALNVNTEGHYCTSILLVIGVLASGSLKSPPQSSLRLLLRGRKVKELCTHIHKNELYMKSNWTGKRPKNITDLRMGTPPCPCSRLQTVCRLCRRRSHGRC